MKNLIIRLVVSTLVLLLGEYFVSSISINGFQYALVLAIVLGILNMTVKPILKILSLPLNLITLGLFSFVINAIIILIADELLGTNFETGGFTSALIFSLVISFLNSITSVLTKD